MILFVYFNEFGEKENLKLFEKEFEGEFLAMEISVFKKCKKLSKINFVKFVDLNERWTLTNIEMLIGYLKGLDSPAIKVFSESEKKTDNLTKIRDNYFHFDIFQHLWSKDMAIKALDSIEKKNFYHFILDNYTIFNNNKISDVIYEKMYSVDNSIHTIKSELLEIDFDDLNQIINRINKELGKELMSFISFEIMYLDYNLNNNINWTYNKLKKVINSTNNSFKLKSKNSIIWSIRRELAIRNWNKGLIINEEKYEKISIIIVMTIALFITLIIPIILVFSFKSDSDNFRFYYPANHKNFYMDNNNVESNFDSDSVHLLEGGNVFLDVENEEYLTLESNMGNLFLVHSDIQLHKVYSEKIFSLSNYYNDIYSDYPVIDENTLNGTFSLHHEVWTDGNYAAFLTTPFRNNEGDIDEEHLVILKDNGTEEWDIIYDFNLQEFFGWNDIDLIEDDVYKIIALNSEEPISNNNIIDFLHINAFDFNIDSKRMFISSRTLGAIFIVNFKNFEEPYLEFVLSNPVTYNYSMSNFDVNPIIKDNGLGDNYALNGYIHNDKYVPTINKNWKGKTLDYIVEGNIYSSESVYWDLDEEYMFMGQHYVRSVNKYLESTNLLGENFNPEHEYITIFDNHGSHDNPYLMHQKENEVGLNRWDNDADGKWDKGSFTIYADRNLFENPVSYFKFIDINPDEKTAELISNFELPYSPYISNAFFLSSNENNYLISNSGSATIDNENNAIFSIFKFDTIIEGDVNNSLSNIKLIFENKQDVPQYRINFVQELNNIAYVGQGI